MNFPDFYNARRVGELYIPNTSGAVDSGRSAGLSRSDEDETRIILLLVDIQVDFVHVDGALSVPGAVEDTRRTIEWIYEHAGRLTTIAASLDSHVPLQIFSPTWWADANGRHPDPFTVISSDDVAQGAWTPLYEQGWSHTYVQQLEDAARKQLMIWPYHTLIGTPGHSLTPALYEAITYHTAARQSQPVFLSKGSLPETEHYSIMEPEVKLPNMKHGGLNMNFLDMLAGYDRVYIAGQAKSHCVLETTTSMMRYFANTPEIISKLYFLRDCTSSVAHPEIDLDAIADETLQRYAEQGLQLVSSQDGIS